MWTLIYVSCFQSFRHHAVVIWTVTCWRKIRINGVEWRNSRTRASNCGTVLPLCRTTFTLRISRARTQWAVTGRVRVPLRASSSYGGWQCQCIYLPDARNYPRVLPFHFLDSVRLPTNYTSATTWACCPVIPPFTCVVAVCFPHLSHAPSIVPCE